MSTNSMSNPTPAASMPVNWMNASWKLLVVRGIVAVIFGIAAMAWPISTAIAFAVLWGFWALLDSMGSFAQAFDRDTPTRGRFLLILMGIIALLAAFFAIVHPAMTAVTLTWILGIWLMVRGVFELVGAFRAGVVTARWLIVLSAILDIVLGILFAANPGRSAVTIAWVLGLFALIWGAVFLVTGLIMRREAPAVDTAG